MPALEADVFLLFYSHRVRHLVEAACLLHVQGCELKHADGAGAAVNEIPRIAMTTHTSLCLGVKAYLRT